MQKSNGDLWFCLGTFSCQNVIHGSLKSIATLLLTPQGSGWWNNSATQHKKIWKFSLCWIYCWVRSTTGRKIHLSARLKNVSCSRFPFRFAQLIHNPDNPLLVIESWLYLVTFYSTTSTTNALFSILKCSFPALEKVMSS